MSTVNINSYNSPAIDTYNYSKDSEEIKRYAVDGGINTPGADSANLSKVDFKVKDIDALRTTITDSLPLVEAYSQMYSASLEDAKQIQVLLEESNTGEKTEEELAAIQEEINALSQGIEDRFNNSSFGEVEFNQLVDDLLVQVGLAPEEQIKAIDKAADDQFRAEVLGDEGIKSFHNGSKLVTPLGRQTQGVTHYDGVSRLMSKFENADAEVAKKHSQVKEKLEFWNGELMNMINGAPLAVNPNVALQASNNAVRKIQNQSATSLRAQANTNRRKVMSVMP
ncbi:MAG: hypothetical protein HRT47_03420 [Candidatus Caenarcaniphilales bacterium]|nr:hypothetical protein [Candidatus Caenarcaniphilales bacterium]